MKNLALDMKKHFNFLLLFFLVSCLGFTCRSPRTCPLNAHAYNLHHLTERGFYHIFEVEVNGANKCSGCHHISAERCGLVKIEKIKTGKYGVFRGRVQKKPYPICSKTSTFFPETWSVQTTLDKIEEAYQNAYVDTYRSDRTTKVGRTQEGVKIRIIMDKHNPDKIYNAYPIMERVENNSYNDEEE